MQAAETKTLQGNPAAIVGELVYIHMKQRRTGDMIVAFDRYSERNGELDEERMNLMRTADAPGHADFVAYVEERELHLAEKAILGRTDSLRVRTSTPWGQADSKTEYGRGINSYGTPGHGGFKVSAGLNAAMPDHLRNDNGWYEEDCEWAKVALAFPDRFTTYEKKEALRSILRYDPAVWEAHTGLTIEPGMSSRRDEEVFLEKHKNDYIVVSATTSNDHPGMVVVTATPGGDREKIRTSEEKTFIVPKDEYGNRLFVVDLDRHEELLPEGPAPRF